MSMKSLIVMATMTCGLVSSASFANLNYVAGNYVGYVGAKYVGATVGSPEATHTIGVLRYVG